MVRQSIGTSSSMLPEPYPMDTSTLTAKKPAQPLLSTPNNPIHKVIPSIEPFPRSIPWAILTMWPGMIKIPMEVNLVSRHMLKLSLFLIRFQETELSSTTPCPNTLLLPTILSILKFLTVRVYTANISSASKPEPMTSATSSPKLAWPDCISTKAPIQSQIPWSPQVNFLQHRCLQVPKFVSG